MTKKKTAQRARSAGTPRATPNARRIPRSEWRWFGNAGHFIAADSCRFHLCTAIGNVLVSTVGEYFPRDAKKVETIGLNRLYETMAFRTTGQFCNAEGCGCGLPEIIPREIEFKGYNTAGDATRGHLEICAKVARSTPTPTTEDGQ